jgi:ATP-binding cassette subfamily F protein 3
VGRNGAGKSTLLKLLNGEIKPDSGTIKEKADLVVGYFGQTNVLSLSPKKTILEELSDTKGSPGETEIRSLCGSLLFSGDDVHKPIEVLSGGEKSRVSLGKLLLSNFINRK